MSLSDNPNTWVILGSISIDCYSQRVTFSFTAHLVICYCILNITEILNSVNLPLKSEFYSTGKLTWLDSYSKLCLPHKGQQLNLSSIHSAFQLLPFLGSMKSFPMHVKDLDNLKADFRAPSSVAPSFLRFLPSFSSPSYSPELHPTPQASKTVDFCLSSSHHPPCKLGHILRQKNCINEHHAWYSSHLSSFLSISASLSLSNVFK